MEVGRLRRRSSVRDLTGFFEEFHQKRRERSARQLKKTLSGQRYTTGRESPRLALRFTERAQSVPVYCNSSGPEESDADDNESVFSMSRDECRVTSKVIWSLDDNTAVETDQAADGKVSGAGRSESDNLSPPEEEWEKTTLTRSFSTEDTPSPTGATGAVVTRRPRVGTLSPFVDIMETLPEMECPVDKAGNVKSVKAAVYSMERGRPIAPRRTGTAYSKRQVSGWLHAAYLRNTESRMQLRDGDRGVWNSL